MTLQVYRTNYSPYQNHQFFQNEKEIIEKIAGVTYVTNVSEFDPNTPFVLITNTHTKPRELSESILERTALMIHPNSGFDNFDIDFIKNAKFPIVLGNPIRSHAVSEYILSSLFHHFTAIPNHHHWDSERLWKRKLLRDQKILIVGHGTIGQILFKALSPLCKNLHVVDPYFKSEITHTNIHQELTDELINGVEVLILATSLNPSSRSLIDEKLLKKLSPEVFIVNAARGELIVEKDLEIFLEKNIKAATYLDVFESEPFKPGHLSTHSRVNKTSHIAGVFERLNFDIIQFEYHIIKEFINYFEVNNVDSFKNDYATYLLKNRIRNDQLF